MESFPIGVGLIQLRLRHAQSLKDKRHVVTGLIQKLRNLGFSATETDHKDNPKQADIGISFAASSPKGLDAAFDQMQKLLIGDFDVVGVFRESLDYEPDYTQPPAWPVGSHGSYED